MSIFILGPKYVTVSALFVVGGGFFFSEGGEEGGHYSFDDHYSLLDTSVLISWCSLRLVYEM